MKRERYMSDQQSTNLEETEIPSMLLPKSSDEPKNHDYDPIATFSSKLLDRSDSFIYAIVGICFLLSGLFTLGYSFWHFGETIFNISTIVANASTSHEPTT